MADLSDSEVARIIDHAKVIWAQRELSIWGPGHHFAKQTWEQGTDLAKRATLNQAMLELGYD